MKRSIKKDIINQIQSEFKKIVEVNVSSLDFDECYKISNGKYLMFVSNDVQKEEFENVLNSLAKLSGESITKGSTVLLVGETEQDFEKGELTAKTFNGLKANFMLIKNESTIYVHKPMSLLPNVGLRGVIESILAHYNYMNVELC